MAGAGAAEGQGRPIPHAVAVSGAANTFGLAQNSQCPPRQGPSARHFVCSVADGTLNRHQRGARVDPVARAAPAFPESVVGFRRRAVLRWAAFRRLLGESVLVLKKGNVQSQTMCLKCRTLSNSCRWFRTGQKKRGDAHVAESPRIERSGWRLDGTLRNARIVGRAVRQELLGLLHWEASRRRQLLFFIYRCFLLRAPPPPPFGQ